MDVRLPDHLEPVIRRRAEAGGFATAADYLAALVEADDGAPLDLTPEEVQRIGDTVLERLDDGRHRIVADDAYWEQKLRRPRTGGVNGG